MAIYIQHLWVLNFILKFLSFLILSTLKAYFIFIFIFTTI
ncbi:hypothetical protein HMPREF0202_00098 [Cetobacterium somerae ATCC BAA-474]|uniref:Uncharacterized protein n=1 Tax=Cetobacterium somerae ATCC BAA-474 TaxID=1319815 RepID=U7VER8_9FUSO|nr:hypothetical protein HMPREF0202_00098 [Cetobacterium somerae ATCC BAA-474]